MKHFDHCQCEKCRPQHPPRAEAACGFLMQQIVVQGRLQERCRRYCLSLSPLPRILVPPYTIRDVQVCGDITVNRENTCGCGEALVTLPLSVLVCDQRGQSHRASASLTVRVPLRGMHYDNALSYLAQAEVRLCPPSPCFDDPAQAPVCLTVCVQVFGVQHKALYAPSPCAPACPPPLPLYPQPRCH